MSVKNSTVVNISGFVCTTDRSESFKIYIWIFNSVNLLIYLLSAGLLSTMYVLIAIRIYKQAHFRKKFLKPTSASISSNVNQYGAEGRSSSCLSVRKQDSSRKTSKSKFMSWRSRRYAREDLDAGHNGVEDEDADIKFKTAISSANDVTNAPFCHQGARKLSFLSFTIEQTISMGDSSVCERVAKGIRPTNVETVDTDDRNTGISTMTYVTHVQIETNTPGQPGKYFSVNYNHRSITKCVFSVTN